MRTGERPRSPLSTLGRFVRDASAATATIFALALPILAGMTALAVEVGVWTVQKRQAQGAADQAAYSAAIATKDGNATARATADAKAIAAGMGFVDGVNGVVVTVNNPPLSGSMAGDTGYWEVIVQQPQSGGLSSLFLSSPPTAEARAVAGGASGGSACMIGLSTTGNALSFANNSSITNPSCTVYSNSSSSTAVYCGTSNGVGAPDIYAKTYVVGNAASNCDFHPTRTSLLFTGQPAIADPYAGVTVTPPACTTNTLVTNGGSFSPGRYCQGFSLAASAPNKVLNFAAGVYYIDRNFSFAGGNTFTINGTGVTFIFRPDTSISTFNFNMANNMIFNLTAPTTGAYKGIVMMGKTNVPLSPLFANNNIMHIQGAIYFPQSNVTLRNNFDSTLCTQVVALTITLENNATMNHNCPGSGIATIGGSTMALIE